MSNDGERSAGQFALRRGAIRMRVGTALIAVVFGIGLAALILASAGRSGLIPAGLVILIALCAKIVGERFMDRAVPWLKGGNAEAAVGKRLAELGEAFIVTHDLEDVVPGNIDHVVEGPTGTFLIETKFKSYRESHLAKAKCDAAKLARSRDACVTPVICVAKRSYGPITHQDVVIVGLPQLLPFIRRERKSR